MKRQLVLGSGMQPDKAYRFEQIWEDVTTVDINPDSNPDVIWDLNTFPYPFKDDEFDEVHAYEIMEHLGRQGDVESFFSQFNELYRIMKDGAILMMSTPKWDTVWAWGDPGHRRIINKGSIVFLDKDEYERQLGKTSMSDYRRYIKCKFKLTLYSDKVGNSDYYELMCVKKDGNK